MLLGLLLVMFFELCGRVNISQCHPMTANHGRRGDFLVHSSRFREFRVLLHPCVIPKPACWSTSKELVMASRLCPMHLQPNEPHQALCSSKVVDILVVQFSACWWKDWTFHLAYCWSVALFFFMINWRTWRLVSGCKDLSFILLGFQNQNSMVGPTSCWPCWFFQAAAGSSGGCVKASCPLRWAFAMDGAGYWLGCCFFLKGYHQGGWFLVATGIGSQQVCCWLCF